MGGRGRWRMWKNRLSPKEKYSLSQGVKCEGKNLCYFYWSATNTCNRVDQPDVQTRLRNSLLLYRVKPGATTSVLMWQMSAENDNTEHGSITTLFFSSKITLNSGFEASASRRDRIWVSSRSSHNPQAVTSFQNKSVHPKDPQGPTLSACQLPKLTPFCKRPHVSPILHLSNWMWLFSPGLQTGFGR